MKTVALLNEKDGSCKFLLEIVNLNEKEYRKLCGEVIKNEQAKAQEKKELKETIENLENRISELEHEVKVLKGEE